MKIIGKYIPAANMPNNIWQGYVTSPYDSDEFLMKVDHQMNTAHRFTANYFLTTGTNTVAAGTGNLPWARQQFNWRQHNVNVSDTWVMASNRINQAWFSFNRNFGGRLNVPPCHAAMVLLATPNPSSSLPPDRSCSVAAWIPMVTALRP